MRKASFIFILLSISISFCFYSFRNTEDQLKSDFVNIFQKSVKSLIISYDSLYIYSNSTNEFKLSKARNLFINLRYAYKRNELFIEYFAPSTAGMLNMALIPDVDEYDPNQYIQEPEGLQKIEEILFESDSDIDVNLLIQELKRTRGAILRAQQISKTLEPLEYQLFEASKQELVRIWTLNLTGIDAVYTKNSIMESKYALHTIVDLINIIEKNNSKRSIRNSTKKTKNLIIEAEYYLVNNNNFDSFNRLYFVKNFINPIYKNIVEIEYSLNYEKNNLPTAINSKSKNIFSKDAINVHYFSSEKKNTSNEKIIELGKMLFFDPVLSGNNQRACASCHRPEYGFSEPIAKSIMFEFKGEVERNAPSLLNVGYQKSYFYDARTTYLEDQIVEVNQNKTEMHGNFDQLVSKLNTSKEYKDLFKEAYKNTNDTTINKYSIIKAIASYERSLSSMNSRFDKYMRNEKIKYTDSEINGFNLFMGKAQCGTCHFAPLFNGTVPPNFDETEWEIIGVPASNKNEQLDNDLGRYNVAKMEIHKYAFKTTTVRNVEYTKPYMHNGVYNSLEEVLNFYNKGGGIGHGYDVPNQTLPSDSLNLSAKEMKDIISFMKSLSDTISLTDKPSRLPEIIINNKVLERKVGGVY